MDQKAESETESNRLVTMEQASVTLNEDLYELERQMAFYLRYMTVYNQSASQASKFHAKIKISKIFLNNSLSIC